jgi:hypothetical protein
LAKTVIMNVSIASADWSYQPMEVVELEDSLADAWIAAGHARLGGDVVGAKESANDNASDGGTNKPSRSKKSPKS